MTMLNWIHFIITIFETMGEVAAFKYQTRPLKFRFLGISLYSVAFFMGIYIDKR